MAIFNSYVKLPEGSRDVAEFAETLQIPPVSAVTCAHRINVPTSPFASMTS
jgi:hypothetical protein